MKRIISLCIIAAVLALAVGGCASASKDTYSNEAPRAPASSSAAPPAAGSAPSLQTPGAPADTAGGQGAQWEPGAEGSTGPLPILTPSNSRGLRYVYTIDLKLQTTAFMDGIRTLLSTIGRMEGYVESADLHGRDLHSPPIERDVEYTFRLYTERLADFLVVVEDNYNILSLRQRSENVTGNYEYGDSAIDDLRLQEARLLTALENTRLDTEARLELEKQLAQTQSSIRYYEREQSDFDNEIFYSTINVQLFEVIFPEEAVEEIEEEAIPAPTFGERFSQAAERSVNGFLAFCQGVLIVLIRLAPTIIVLIVLAVIALFIYRGVKKHRKKQKEALRSSNYIPQNQSAPVNGAGNGTNINQDK